MTKIAGNSEGHRATTWIINTLTTVAFAIAMAFIGFMFSELRLLRTDLGKHVALPMHPVGEVQFQHLKNSMEKLEEKIDKRFDRLESALRVGALEATNGNRKEVRHVEVKRDGIGSGADCYGGGLFPF